MFEKLHVAISCLQLFNLKSDKFKNELLAKIEKMTATLSNYMNCWGVTNVEWSWSLEFKIFEFKIVELWISSSKFWIKKKIQNERGGATINSKANKLHLPWFFSNINYKEDQLSKSGEANLPKKNNNYFFNSPAIQTWNKMAVSLLIFPF